MSPPGIVILDPLRFTIDRGEVVRLLGYGRRGDSPARRVVEAIDACLREAEELFEAMGCHTSRPLDIAPRRGPFRGAERIAYGVCTIGPRLPERVTELARRGEPLRALVLDAVGSAAVEAATDVLEAAICGTLGRQGIFSGRRVSPGYPSWPIEGQREIFSLLPSAITGVRLTDALCMEPRKSVSFAVGIGREVRPSKREPVCACCRLRGCPFRRQPCSA